MNITLKNNNITIKDNSDIEISINIKNDSLWDVYKTLYKNNFPEDKEFNMGKGKVVFEPTKDELLAIIDGLVELLEEKGVL